MREGPPDSNSIQSHLALLSGASSPHSSEVAPSMSPPNVALLFREEAPSSAPPTVCKFGATVAIRLPGDAIRHPRLPDQLRQELGRICAVDLLHDGVRVGFGAHGESLEEAADDSRAVVERLLGWLGLGDAALVEQTVFARDLGLLTAIEQGRLRAVPDLP